MNKIKKTEDFPVGKFVKRSLKPVVDAYYNAAREADDVADCASLSCNEKLEKLKNIRKDFCDASDTIAGKLGKIFAKENLDYRLFVDLLEAFENDAKGQNFEIWEQVLYYCQYSAAPVGRFMLAIHDEAPSTYMPAETLCAVLQIVNFLRDMKDDMCKLKRCYMPEDLLQKYGVWKRDFCLSHETLGVNLLKKEVLTRLEAMLKDAKILLSLIKNFRLKIELGVIFSLTNIMIKKMYESDIIAQKQKLSRFDWMRAVVCGMCLAFVTRKKSCSINLK